MTTTPWLLALTHGTRAAAPSTLPWVEIYKLQLRSEKKVTAKAPELKPSDFVISFEITFKGKVDYIETVAGTLETRNLNASFQTEFENSDEFIADVQQSYELLFDPFDISSNISIPVGGYEFQDYYIAYGMGAQRRISGRLSLQVGDFFGGITVFAHHGEQIYSKTSGASRF